jgi:hypothetical protein
MQNSTAVSVLDFVAICNFHASFNFALKQIENESNFFWIFSNFSVCGLIFIITEVPNCLRDSDSL